MNDINIGINRTNQLLDRYEKSKSLFFLCRNWKTEKLLKANQKFTYDEKLKIWSIHSESLDDLSVRKILQKCIRKKEFTVNDLESDYCITLGKASLIKALNHKYDADAIIMQGFALQQCLFEKSKNFNGALQSYSALLKNKSLATAILPYGKVYEKAIEQVGKTGLSDASALIFRKSARLIENYAAKRLQKLEEIEISNEEFLKNIDDLGSNIIKSYFMILLSANCSKEEISKSSMVDGLIDFDLPENVKKRLLKYLDIKSDLDEVFDRISSFDDLKSTLIGCLKEYEITFDFGQTIGSHVTSLNPYLPLYLDLSYENKIKLPEQYKLVWDPNVNAWLCEFSPENKEIFRDFLPRPTYEMHIPVNTSDVRTDMINKLLSEGFSSRCVQSLKFDSNWHHDREPGHGHLAYCVSMQKAKPVLLWFDHKKDQKAKAIDFNWKDEKERHELARYTYHAEYVNQLASLNEKSEHAAALQKLVCMLEPVTDGSDPYCHKKNIDLSKAGALKDPCGEFTRQMAWYEQKKDPQLLKKCIYMPIYNTSGALVNMQMLREPGVKLFYPGTPLKGAFSVIGGFEKLRTSSNVILCEGIATGASIASCTPAGTAVVCCLSCNNLRLVAGELGRNFPDKQFGICADNDVLTASTVGVSGEYYDNVGVCGALAAKAEFACLGIDCSIILPGLSVQEYKNKKSDFNDALIEHAEDTKQRIGMLCQRLNRRTYRRIEGLNLGFKKNVERFPNKLMTRCAK